MADLLHQCGHIVLHLPDHVCQRDALALQQLVDADAQQLAQRQHIARLRQPLPALPFGDGLFTEPQRLRQRALGVSPLPPHGGYKASRFFLIHTDPLLHCMSIAHCTSAGEPTNRRFFCFSGKVLTGRKWNDIILISQRGKCFERSSVWKREFSAGKRTGCRCCC